MYIFVHAIIRKPMEKRFFNLLLKVGLMKVIFKMISILKHFIIGSYIKCFYRIPWYSWKIILSDVTNIFIYEFCNIFPVQLHEIVCSFFLYLAGIECTEQCKRLFLLSMLFNVIYSVFTTQFHWWNFFYVIVLLTWVMATDAL